VAAAGRQFGNPEDMKCPLLEAVTREAVKTQLTENIKCVL
jgi:hypothetical protein